MANKQHWELNGADLHEPKAHTHDTLYLKRSADDFGSAGTVKASPDDADRVLIEDSAVGFVKKYAQLGNLPGGGGSATWTGLTDTVAAIVANQLVIGNGAGTQLGFVNPSTLDVGKVDGCDAGVATANVFKIPASLTRGDIFFVNVSGNVVRLGAGTSGHFLKTQSTAADPIWAPVPGGGALGDLSDVTISPPATTGDTIIHNGSVFVNANIDTRIMATKLDDFATPNDNIDLNASTVQHGLLPKLGGGTVNFLRADGSWAAPPGAAGGETNTASNQGIGGVGVYYQKVGVDLQFKNINAGSNQISITDDTGNHEIDIDVVESNIKLDDLGTPDDTIDLNASTLRHGLLSKLGGGTVNFLRADGTWSEPPGAAGGEANTGSNVGTAGVGVFKQKTGADLEFKKINAGSSNITITDDVANNEVDIDVSTNVFLADGTVPMAGGLDLGSHSTTNVFSLKAADASGIEIRDSVNNVIAYFGYPAGKTTFSGDLGMGANWISNVQGIAGPTAGGNMLALTGDSDTYNSRIYLYSNTFGGLSQYEGQIKFDMVNAALNGVNTAVEIDGKTDNPLLHVYYGLDMNSKKIESLLDGSDAGDAVRYDQVVLRDGANSLTGDWNPDGNGTRSIGDATHKLAEIWAVNGIFGDLVFEERACHICEEPFNEGEILSLVVVKTSKNGTHTVPVHSLCIGGDN